MASPSSFGVFWRGAKCFKGCSTRRSRALSQQVLRCNAAGWESGRWLCCAGSVTARKGDLVRFRMF